jgi:hypothetical protein
MLVGGNETRGSSKEETNKQKDKDDKGRKNKGIRDKEKIQGRNKLRRQ